MLHQQIKAKRLEKCLTQLQVGEAIGKSRCTIINAEKGKITVQFCVLVKLCKFLGIEKIDLTKEWESKK